MAYRKIKFDSSRKVYVILDLNAFRISDLRKLDYLLSGQICAIQIWDNQKVYEDKFDLLEQIIAIAHVHEIPVLINNQVSMLPKLDFDGVHFDEIPIHWDDIKDLLQGKIVGMTCTNDEHILTWAAQQHIDYLSFCSLFPSANNSKCELVNREFLIRAQKQLQIPFFLAGGITPENIPELNNLNYQGIALVSGLMQQEQPKEIVEKYYNQINQNHENNHHT
ncbi:thiamine phosphate synthase [Sphingobacterium composti Ten et al. 2007 non Yoo et al. 2007]|uniref:thiamine phosphate synthase n=1 Tax=Sphingobacterium composti TaxID=363260 RepID=UPI00135C23CC|nr:thiamine phosphate synthase [Sphingobacterium composti Ten et al. 2007 non Yoo et al. 2007]